VRAIGIIIPVGIAVIGIVLTLFTTADFVSSLQPELIVSLALGALVAVFLAVQPIILLWFTTIITLVVAGSARYFIPKLGHLWWLAYGSAFLLFMPPLVHSLRGRAIGTAAKSPLLKLSAIGFAFVAAVSTALAVPPVGQLVVTTKSMLMFGGVWALFAMMPMTERNVQRWLAGMLGIGLIQWIPVLYQFFVIRRHRIETTGFHVESADAVVGTFGGNPDSGGLTAILAFFIIANIVVLFSFRKERMVSLPKSLVIAAILMVPLPMMEVKVFFVYMPVAFATLYWRELIHKPLILVAWVILVGGAMGGMLYVYQQIHWSALGTNRMENTKQSFMYSFTTKSGNGSLTRLGVLEYWWERHGFKEPVEFLIGHGAGSSRTQGQVPGVAAVENRLLNIDRTGASIVLWDFGLLGAILLMGMMLGLFRLLGRIAHVSTSEPWVKALAGGLRAVVPMFFLSMFYRNDIPYAAPLMFLFMATLGLTSWLGRQSLEKNSG